MNDIRMKIFKTLSLLLIGLFFGCSDDEVFPDSSYPTKVSSLSESALDDLFFSIENSPIYNCTQLNAFGFFLFDIKSNDNCTISSDFKANFTENELVVVAKNAILEYGRFTNVSDTSQLLSPTVTAYSGQSYDDFVESYPDSSPVAWYVSFASQKLENMEVRGTILRVLVGPLGELSIHGNWYKSVYVPQRDAISEEQARLSIYGKTFTSGSYSIVPSESSTWYDSQKIIVPIKKTESIELRVCWALYPNNWEIMVDSQSGLVVSVSRLLED